MPNELDVFTEQAWEQHESQKKNQELGYDVETLSSDEGDQPIPARQILLLLQGSYGKAKFKVMEVPAVLQLL